MTRIALSMILIAAITAAAENGHALLEQALVKERIGGDLPGAIKLYQQILQNHAANRKLAATALLQLARCYEKQGSTEARKTYDRLVREYADQTETVAEARTRLAALTKAPDSAGVAVRQVWAGATAVPQGSISPEGRYVSFVEIRDGLENLAVRDLATGNNRVLTKHKPGEMAESSIFSPDGKQIAYAVDWDKPQHGYEVRTIGIDGSQPRIVLPYQERIHDMVIHGWSRDGKSILAMIQAGGESQIVWIAVADGFVRKVHARPRPGSGYRSPRAGMSPDSKYIAYEAVTGSEEQQRDVMIVAADGSGDRPLIESRFDDYLLGWMPNGSAVLFASNRSGAYDVWMQEVSDGKPQGAPVLIKRDIGGVKPMGLVGNSLLYSTAFPTCDVFTASLNSDGTDRRALTLADTRLNVLPAWSPDGARIAYFSAAGHAEQPMHQNLIIREVESGREVEFQTGIELRGPKPVWTADSRSLLIFGKSRSGPGYFRIEAASGKPELMAKWDLDWFRGPSISSDGRIAVHYRPIDRSQPTRRAVYRRDLATGHDTVLHQVDGPEYIQDGVVSPDGKDVALKLFSRPPSIVIVPTAGGKPREIYRGPAALRFDGIAWSPDGRDLIFARLAEGGGKTELWSVPARGGEPRKLGLAAAGLLSFDVHPDGKRLVYSVAGRSHHEIWALDNIKSSATALR